VSVDRSRIAGWLGGVAGAGAAGIAMLVCCATTTTAAAGGGLAAAGGVLRSPWLIVAGLVIIVLAAPRSLCGTAATAPAVVPYGAPSAADPQPAATNEAGES
jgi:hypothetical protein